MEDAQSAYLDQVLGEILEVTEGEPQGKDVEKISTRSIERKVRQCYALLRQELERKVKQQPGLYDKERLESTLKAFENGIPDIQQAIAERVLESVSEIIRQEIRRILEDALRDLLEDVQASGDLAIRAASMDAETTPQQKPVAEQEIKPTLESRAPDIPLPAPTPAPEGLEEQEEEGTEIAASAAAATIAHFDEADDQLYEGKIKLNVQTRGSMKEMLRFLNHLGNDAEVRVLQMIGTSGTITVWISLRRPLLLKQYLAQMVGVAEVTVRSGTSSEGSEDQVMDVLIGSPSTVSSIRP